MLICLIIEVFENLTLKSLQKMNYIVIIILFIIIFKHKNYLLNINLLRLHTHYFLLAQLLKQILWHHTSFHIDKNMISLLLLLS